MHFMIQFSCTLLINHFDFVSYERLKLQFNASKSIDLTSINISRASHRDCCRWTLLRQSSQSSIDFNLQNTENIKNLYESLQLINLIVKRINFLVWPRRNFIDLQFAQINCWCIWKLKFKLRCIVVRAALGNTSFAISKILMKIAIYVSFGSFRILQLSAAKLFLKLDAYFWAETI